MSGGSMNYLYSRIDMDATFDTENEAIRKCLGNAAILESLIEQANETLFALQSEITRAENTKAGE